MLLSAKKNVNIFGIYYVYCSGMYNQLFFIQFVERSSLLINLIFNNHFKFLLEYANYFSKKLFKIIKL